MLYSIRGDLNMTVTKLMFEYDKDDLCRMEAAQLGSYLAHAIGSHESVPHTVALIISMQNYVEEQVNMFAEAFNGTRKLLGRPLLDF
jgi:hypothetical protein